MNVGIGDLHNLMLKLVVLIINVRDVKNGVLMKVMRTIVVETITVIYVITDFSLKKKLKVVAPIK
jgi:hypothetical protein